MTKAEFQKTIKDASELTMRQIETSSLLEDSERERLKEMMRLKFAEMELKGLANCED